MSRKADSKEHTEPSSCTGGGPLTPRWIVTTLLAILIHIEMSASDRCCHATMHTRKPRRAENFEPRVRLGHVCSPARAQVRNSLAHPAHPKRQSTLFSQPEADSYPRSTETHRALPHLPTRLTNTRTDASDRRRVGRAREPLAGADMTCARRNRAHRMRCAIRVGNAIMERRGVPRGEGGLGPYVSSIRICRYSKSDSDPPIRAPDRRQADGRISEMGSGAKAASAVRDCELRDGGPWEPDTG